MKTTKNFKILIGLFFLFMASNTLIGQSINQKDAKSVAKNFFSTQFENKALNTEVASVHEEVVNGTPYYYIINMQPEGFVIVAADERVNPIIAFSDQNSINPETIDSQFHNYMGKHKVAIKRAMDNGAATNNKIKNKWSTLKAANIDNAIALEDIDIVVGPLTTTVWGQEDYYNAGCPAAPAGKDGHCYTGCVATCMAQILKYYEASDVGYGAVDYNDAGYGPQSADFCNSNYDWDNMPDVLTDYNDDVAQLMYHSAVSVEMDFHSTSSSLAYFSDMALAFDYFFGYDSDIQYLKKNEFSGNLADWHNLIKNELDNDRIVALRGASPSGNSTHAWVCDGYSEEDYFHMNWGWAGEANGWYADSGENWEGIEWDNPEEEFDISFYYQQSMIYNMMASDEGCEKPSLSLIDTGTPNDNYCYFYIDQPIGNTYHEFRYRPVGSDEWLYSGEDTIYYFLAQSLQPETEYEFQASHQCCGEEWSDYSDSYNFTTMAGEAPEPCATVDGDELAFGSITGISAYVYTPQPFGDVDNQFRYREVDTSEWTYTDMNDDFYRQLEDLLPGTTYEVQVRHECNSGNWGEYSSSAEFTTEGEAPPEQGCDVPDGLETSSVNETYAYVYVSQPYGDVDNQFRFREVGTSEWTETNIADIHYRLLTNLTAGTNYEFQARHICPNNNEWSPYSTSETFTTPGEFTNGCEEVDIDAMDADEHYIYYFDNTGDNNQFRWRANALQIWNTTAISEKHYRRKPSNLPDGGTIELQVRYQCAPGEWSEYSSSFFFTQE